MSTDSETEILTINGWRRCDQVRAGDPALTLNVGTGLAEWQPLEAVNVFEGPHDVIEMRNLTHSSVTTPGHRWPVMFTSHGGRRPGWDWRTTEAMPSDTRILAAAPVTAPAEPKWSDAMVELVAWLWTEGWAGKHGSVTLAQSDSANPGYVARIRAALTETFGPAGELFIRSRPSWREDRDGAGSFTSG